MSDWIDNTVIAWDQWLDVESYEDWEANLEYLREHLRKAHARNCRPLTNELAERIAVAIADASKERAIHPLSGSWLKEFILRVRDGEVKGESK